MILKINIRILFIVSCVFMPATNLAVTVDALRKLNIPLVSINTVNGEIPTCDYVFAPEGQDGVSTTNQTKVPARMYIIQNSDTLYDSGDYVEDASGLTIRIRGNTSAYYYPMKPYKLKLQKKADLLLRGDKKYNDKDWVLLNEYRLDCPVGNKVSEVVGIKWHPQSEYVNVVLNNKYQGLYILTESIKRNPDCRVDVSKNEGYIFENDAYWWNETVCADTHVIGLRYKYTFKYPDSDDITQQQVDYISTVMDDVEASILNGTYPDKIDVASFARWMLVHDIIGTMDSGGSNMFLTKYDNSSKVCMSCPWDFSGMMNSNDYTSYADTWSRRHTSTSFYYPYLFSNTNDEFVKEYVQIWNDIKLTLLSAMDEYFSGLEQTKSDLDASRTYTRLQWSGYRFAYTIGTVQSEIDGMQSWFKGRQTWLDEHVNELTSDIKTVCSEPAASHKIYNMQGIRVSSPVQSGIYIVDGKKYITNR